jgi:hypothetical protein
MPEPKAKTKTKVPVMPSTTLLMNTGHGPVEVSGVTLMPGESHGFPHDEALRLLADAHVSLEASEE